MSNRERQCSKCNRVYSWADWQELDCPFCDVPLAPANLEYALLGDTLSLQLPWPAPEKAVVVGLAEGYLKAQVIKAALETASIPVLLQGETVTHTLGLWFGSLGAIRILVPESMIADAEAIVNINEN